MRGQKIGSVILMLILAGFGSVEAAAQQKPTPEAPPKSAPAAAENRPVEQDLPGPRRTNLLIRSTIIALNHANMTGNYSVLRDLGAPGFQEANNPARLAEIFAALRKRNIDFSPVMFFDPKLVRPPSIQGNGLLRLSGFIPTEPEQVDFDLAFQKVGGEWRLFGIAVDTSRPAPSATGKAQPAAGASDANAPPAAGKK